MKYAIWYMRPDFFRVGIFGDRTADTADLARTHVHLKDIEAADLEAVFREMQGEVWSPNGEARGLILSKGLRHTSMSVGDIAVDPEGRVFSVAISGFRQIGEVRT